MRRLADVAPGTFYNYFTTREEILDAVAASLVDEFRIVIAAIQRSIDDPAERIAVAVRLFLERVRDDALWGWFMARYGPSLPILRDQTREIIRERIEALASGCRDLASDPRLSRLDKLGTTLDGMARDLGQHLEARAASGRG